MIGASDNVGVVSTNQTAGLPSGALFPVGKTTNTFVVADAAGNTNTCTFVVTVRDTQPPVITCPGNVTVNADPGQCYASLTNVVIGNPVASDQCGGVTVTSNAPALFPVGTNTVTWTATDASGNTNTCAQLVIVHDNPPAITAQPQSRTNPAGTAASFTVGASACTPLSYQWYSGTALLPGRTGSTLEIPSVLPVHAGPYSVVVTGAGGSVTSEVATLTITIPPQGVQPGVLYAFSESGSGPRNPYSRLLQAGDGTLYGTTYSGGTSNLGTVFQLTTNGTLLEVMSFNGTNGAQPRAGLITDSSGQFYGTATSGGSAGMGTLFQATGGGALSALADFSGSNGMNPNGDLLQAGDGAFYGTTTSGGALGCGAVFSFHTNSGLALLASFDSSTQGINPMGGLVAAGRGTFYGTTMSQGSNGFGAVFRFNTNGTLTTLVSFAFTNGASPTASLIRGNDGNCYGTTSEGGADSQGTVFQMTPNGALTTVLAFNGTNGAWPIAALLQAADGNFYGTTWAGGASDYGTVFKLTPAGTLTTLLAFNNTNGANPYAGLLQASDGQLYGTTVNGGPDGGGTVFRVALDPRILSQPAGLTTLAGATVKLNVLAQGTAPLAYQWQFNGADLADGGNISGALSPTLTLTSVTTNQSGSYAVLVAGPSGLVTSSPATLTVLPPGQMVAGLRPDGTFALSFTTLSNLALRIEASADLLDWVTLTNIPDAAGPVQFLDLDATNHAQRFYRAVWTP